MSASRSHPKLHILFDSSVAYSRVGHHLLGRDLSAFIFRSLESRDIITHWYLCSIVKQERRYQMVQEALTLLPALQKIGKLLGNEPGISEQMLNDKIDELIANGIKRHQLNEVGIDHDAVDWGKIIDDSVLRKPPFQREEEKGFRDAILVETFFQVAESLISTDRDCTVFLLTDDKLMIDAALERAKELSNIRIVRTLDDLQSAINAITSQLTPQQIEEILLKASAIFYRVSDPSTFYYTAKIPNKIEAKYSAALLERPKTAPNTTAQSKYVDVAPTVFLNKSGDRLVFSTRVTYVVELMDRFASTHTYIYPGSGAPNVGGTSSGSYPASISTGSLGPVTFIPSGANTANVITFTPGTAGGTASTITVSTGSVSSITGGGTIWTAPEVRRFGRHHFEVLWSVIRNDKGELSNARLDEIRYHSVEWNT